MIDLLAWPFVACLVLTGIHAYLASLTKRMKEAQLRVLIAEPYSNAAVVAKVAALSGAREVRLASSVGAEPDARDYIALFDLDIARLADALRPR